ncbi:hypothetical protein EAS64_33775 [Trebonia kvetii]|uniref:Uncharacterized protein n=1 Tax=Trebonia kvetii TaxID=2480626 RepID=A0A6P2BS46_9ACTN|nr:hypothetical protein [Trebonia kvetii]TVZ01251.1 hypothetical protein EAS64_33775 [Trebonia kvetii]
MDINDFAPNKCCECGADLSGVGGYPVKYAFGVDVIRTGGDGQRTTERTPYAEMTKVTVPGLYRCHACFQAIADGELVSELTFEQSLAWAAEMCIRADARLDRLRKGGRAYRELKKWLDEALNSTAELAFYYQRTGNAPSVGVLLGDELVRSYENEDQPAAEAAPDDADAMYRKLLASIELGPEGFTYLCPNCDKRHDAEWLVGNMSTSFLGVGDDSKD